MEVLWFPAKEEWLLENSFLASKNTPAHAWLGDNTLLSGFLHWPVFLEGHLFSLFQSPESQIGSKFAPPHLTDRKKAEEQFPA